MDRAVAETNEAVRTGGPVTVYGDFDADGVCATAIIVNMLRQIGADCDWFIPDRISAGYGLNPDAIREISGRGTRLVITVDCGVTSVEEVELAKSLGMGIIVTDHHRTGAELPACTILHPQVSGYPFPQLCGAAVAAKFASAVRREAGLDPALDEDDLDLVALASVADVMPLTGENRRLVREGLQVARRARRPGMRALIAECRLEASRLSSEDLGFRLGPRINAAGRIYRADAGVELFLCNSADRAAEIANELGRANSERRRIEREVETAAESARRDLGEQDPPVLVLAGDGWHPGVIGIVAAKLVRRHGVPAVVIALDGGAGRGSARGVPGLDLHDAIASTADLLEGFGGHAAAAGLQIRTERIPEFRDALGRAVSRMLGESLRGTNEPVDAFAGGSELAIGLAEEFERLEPCGKDNPGIALLIPSARITDLREIGDGKHCRFTVVSGGARAAGVCFGRAGFGVDEDTPLDLLAEISVNHWNGSSEARIQVRDAFPLPRRGGEDRDRALQGCEAGEWWQRFDFAMDGDAPLERLRTAGDGAVAHRRGDRPDAVLDGPAEVVLAELVSSGEPLLVVTADARRRWLSLGGAEGVARFAGAGGDRPVSGLWSGSPGDAAGAFFQTVSEGVGLTDYESLLTLAGPVPESALVLLFDPPASDLQKGVALSCGRSAYATSDRAAIEFAVAAAVDGHSLTGDLRVLFRSLKDAVERSGGGDAGGEELLEILRGDRDHERSPERAALLLRVLIQTGLARTESLGGARRAGIVSSEKVDLTDSPLFSEQERLYKEQVAFLRQSNR